jgi:hypothetical protein
MSKHTPGPWEAIHTTSAGWNVRRRHERPSYTGLAPVCSMAWWQFDIPGIIDEEISAANARLIAAAPELLEALRSVLKYYAPSALECAEWALDGNSQTDAILRKARAAIAKAIGGAE